MSHLLGFCDHGKLIHLLLLLAATVQLPLVSVSPVCVLTRRHVTVKLPRDWTINYCCRGRHCGSVGSCILQGASGSSIPGNLSIVMIGYLNRQHHGYSHCCGTSHTRVQPVHLRLGIDCWPGWPLFYCRVDFSGSQSSGDNCKAHCQYRSNNQPISDSICPPEPRWYAVWIVLRAGVAGETVTNQETDGEDAAGLRFYPKAKSWIDALEHCNHMNSSLVEITNWMVQAAVDSLLQNETNSMQRGVWIGLERSIFGTSVPWKWISGSEAEGHLPWNASFPVDVLNYHCGKIIWVKELQQFRWLDARCREELPYICQFEMS